MARLSNRLAKLETRFRIKPRYTEAEIEAARENVARMLDRAIEYLVEGGEPNCPIHFALLHPDGPTVGLDLMLERRRKEMSDARLAH
jgi:hypothetical protein